MVTLLSNYWLKHALLVVALGIIFPGASAHPIPQLKADTLVVRYLGPTGFPIEPVVVSTKDNPAAFVVRASGMDIPPLPNRPPSYFVVENGAEFDRLVEIVQLKISEGNKGLLPKEDYILELSSISGETVTSTSSITMVHLYLLISQIDELNRDSKDGPFDAATIAMYRLWSVLAVSYGLERFK